MNIAKFLRIAFFITPPVAVFAVVVFLIKSIMRDGFYYKGLKIW